MLQGDSSASTEIGAGTVDVYAIDDSGLDWRVLVLRRSDGTRCPGSWEAIHGKLEPGERPEHGAVRELVEETGLEAERLYVVTVQPFYMRPAGRIDLAIVFAAFVSPGAVTLAAEHREYAWLPVEAAAERFSWPRERQALREIRELLSDGHAGAVEDVLRVR